MSNPEVKDLVQIGLRERGYDGLYNEELGCACLVDDLMPCVFENNKCEAGYRIPCPGPEECSEGGCDSFHIVRERRKSRQKEEKKSGATL